MLTANQRFYKGWVIYDGKKEGLYSFIIDKSAHPDINLKEGDHVEYIDIFVPYDWRAWRMRGNS